MRAVVADEYGEPAVLQVREVDDPKVGPDYVQVRVHAAGINPVDCKIVGAGTWGEQVAVPARGIAAAPVNIDSVAASCLPLAGLTAWQCLVEDIAVGEGDTLLIHAATGGVGHLATQIAVESGVRVIGTCSEPNHDFLRELGGEPVAYGEGLADRLREVAPDGVDAVADFVGDGALDVSDELLRAPGRIVSIRDPQGAKQRGGTYVFVRPDVAHLAALAELVEAGKLSAHVQSVHDLDAVRGAVGEASGGKVRGKVVLRVP